MTETPTIILPKSQSARSQIVTLLLLLLLGAEILFLVADWPILPAWFTRRAPTPDTPRIGELLTTHRTVRSQLQGEVSWEAITPNAALYLRQSLSTGEGARAEVVLEDGTGLSIGENTLIELEQRASGGGLRLKLRRGSLSTRGGGKRAIEVELGGARVELKAGSLAVFEGVTRERAEPQAQVLQGAAQITGGGREHPVQVQAGERVAMSAPLAFAHEALQIVAPTQDTTWKELRVEVNWTIDRTQAPTAPMHLEASESPTFEVSARIGETVVPIAEPAPPSIRAHLTLNRPPREALYLRVRSERRGAPLVSGTRRLWWEASAPAQAPVAAPRAMPVAAPVAAPTAAPTPEAKTPAPQVKPAAAKPKAASKPRVRQTPTPHVAPKKKSPPPPPDDLDADVKKEKKSARGKRAQWNLWDLLLPQAHAEDAPPLQMHATATEDAGDAHTTEAPPRADDESVTLELRWRAVDGAQGYRVQIGKDSEFKQVLGERDVDVPQWIWPVPDELVSSKDPLYYRVASKGDGGEVGAFSRAKSIEIPKAPLPGAWAAQFWLHTGLGSFSQSSSDAGLTSVSLQRPFFQQKIQTLVAWARDNDAWIAGAVFWIAGFHKPDTTQTTIQPDTIAWSLRVDAQRWSTPKRSRAEWSWGVGLSADRNYRWVKTSIQVLDPQGTFALGPSAGIVRHFKGSALWLPREAGGNIYLPITGVLSGAQWGVASSAYGEWKFLKLGKNSLGARLEAELSYLRWSSPTGTGTFNWAVWLAPSFAWGSL